MKWIDISNGCGGHNGEYDWKCSNCGNEDWQAHGVNPNKDGTKCRACGIRPVVEKEVEKVMSKEFAFPIQAAPVATGMTLRDYFAAKALAGVVAHPDSDKHGDKELATQAYNLADAMLKARNEE